MKNFHGTIASGSVLASLFFIFTFALPSVVSATEYFFITTTDYETGSSSVVWLDGSYTNDNDVASIYSDAVSRWYKGLVYVVNRLGGDNIQVLDPSNGFSTVRQFSVGNGSDPHDIAFASETKAYVTRYRTNDLWIVNPSIGSYLGSIDLSSLADGDGICEMDQMILIGNRLFITIQRIDRNNWWLPVGDSYVAVVDTDADTLMDTDPAAPGTQSIPLAGTNPFSNIQYDPYNNRLYVSCVGYWAAEDAGVEAVNQATCCSEGFILTGAEAGGDISDVEILSPDKGYAIVIVSDSNPYTELISFDPSTGTIYGAIYSPGAYVINDIELSPGGELFLADRTETNPGIRIYDTCDDSQITSGPIDVGLPPFDICFCGVVQTSAETPIFASLDQNYPNPFNPSTTISFTLSRGLDATLSIYDASGRRVKTLIDREVSKGHHEVVWNGLSESGFAVSSGVYFIRLRAGDSTSSIKALLLR